MKKVMLPIMLLFCFSASAQINRFSYVPSTPGTASVNNPGSVNERIIRAEQYWRSTAHQPLLPSRWYTGMVTSENYICQEAQFYLSQEGTITKMKVPGQADVDVPGGTKVENARGMFIGPDPKSDGTVATRYFTVYFR